MSKKKILYITLRSDLGGGPKHVDSLIENFNKEFEIFAAAPIDDPFGTKWLELLGNKKFFSLPHRKFSPLNLFALINFIKKNDISTIHAHGKGAGVYARLIKLLNRRAYIIYTWHGLHIGGNGILKRRFYVLIEKFFERYTDLFINVSEGEKIACIKVGIYKNSNVEVIPNGITDIYDQSLNKTLLREKLGLPINKKIVVTVNRFEYSKNMDEAFQIAKLFSTKDDIIFLWIGDGEEKPQIDNKMMREKLENIFAVGYRNNTLDYIFASDVYLSTSRWEGLPYSLLEACMMGIPIVASDVRGNNEVVDDGINGKLYKLGDLNSALECLNEILADSNSYKIMSVNSRIIFEEKFTIDKMVNRLRFVYYKIGNQ